MIGSKKFISNECFIESAIYLGLINWKIKNIDRESQLKNDLKGKIFAKAYKDLEESSGTILNLSIAFRIGITL